MGPGAALKGGMKCGKPLLHIECRILFGTCPITHENFILPLVAYSEFYSVDMSIGRILFSFDHFLCRCECVYVVDVGVFMGE